MQGQSHTSSIQDEEELLNYSNEDLEGLGLPITSIDAADALNHSEKGVRPDHTSSIQDEEELLDYSNEDLEGLPITFNRIRTHTSILHESAAPLMMLQH